MPVCVRTLHVWMILMPAIQSYHADRSKLVVTGTEAQVTHSRNGRAGCVYVWIGKNFPAAQWPQQENRTTRCARLYPNTCLSTVSGASPEIT